jgi:hypothetical protein
VLQWCYSGVTVVLQSCYSRVTVVLQRCCGGVAAETSLRQRVKAVPCSTLIRWCYSDDTVVSQQCYSSVIMVLLCSTMIQLANATNANLENSTLIVPTTGSGSGERRAETSSGTVRGGASQERCSDRGVNKL